MGVLWEKGGMWFPLREGNVKVVALRLRLAYELAKMGVLWIALLLLNLSTHEKKAKRYSPRQSRSLSFISSFTLLPWQLRSKDGNWSLGTVTNFFAVASS